MKIGAFGEVMLRLTPPEHLMLEQTHNLTHGLHRDWRKSSREPCPFWC